MNFWAVSILNSQIFVPTTGGQILSCLKKCSKWAGIFLPDTLKKASLWYFCAVLGLVFSMFTLQILFTSQNLSCWQFIWKRSPGTTGINSQYIKKCSGTERKEKKIKRTYKNDNYVERLCAVKIITKKPPPFCLQNLKLLLLWLNFLQYCGDGEIAVSSLNQVWQQTFVKLAL